MSRIGRERRWPPTTREQFDRLRSRSGALVLGSPDDVIEKLLFEHQLFGYSRFCLQISFGGIPHEQVLRAIELLGTRVAPALRAATAG
jgi:alkanesulfonate monooxygenase SsuD/methylene tetrahydromethanopterin reductase-like flavin-dependent oxidoreductase (luciferase family)